MLAYLAGIVTGFVLAAAYGSVLERRNKRVRVISSRIYGSGEPRSERWKH